ncbi:potassium channel family protein [Priestia taiwanensis]|uniref:LCTB protein n=1 Tax=Priestia taiwanensis TaxID=1347902 RepID=A0A917AVC4_9BACI|nr:potassium channel family protein [Priestia taiwanensis]MBM7364619.1 potassium channel LctB [Priestia taiwanensis]GGE78240.1 LCTB protein [Priestia taiwanensis]
MVYVLILSIVMVGIIRSLQHLWRSVRKRNYFFSFSNLFLLCSIYATILIGFGLIYLSLEVIGIEVLRENNKTLGETGGRPSAHLIEVCMYFSAITLLSVGYGDIVPYEIGRWIAIVEALVGYTMPAAFVVQTMRGRHPRNRRK